MQRYVRMFGTPITLLVLLLILIFGARWGYRNVMAPAPPAPLIPCTQQSVGSALKTSDVDVTVLNGGNTAGLASTVANQLRGVGFGIDHTGNATETVTTTTIVGAAKGNPEVKLLAGFFPGAKIVEDGRADHSVEVHVGNAKTGFTSSAPKQVKISGTTVCLPSPIATPSS